MIYAGIVPSPECRHPGKLLLKQSSSTAEEISSPFQNVANSRLVGGGEGSRPRRLPSVYLPRLHMSSPQPSTPRNGKPSIATLNLQAAIRVQEKWERSRADLSDLSPLMMDGWNQAIDQTDTGTPFLVPFFRARSRRLPKGQTHPRGGAASAPPPVHVPPRNTLPPISRWGTRRSDNAPLLPDRHGRYVIGCWSCMQPAPFDALLLPKNVRHHTM